MLTVQILKAEADQLESELAQFEPKRKRLALLRELIGTYGESPSQGILLDAPSANPTRRFANVGVTDAIRMFLAETPREWFSPRDVAKALLEGGHNSASPNFFNIVYTICKRRAESGEFDIADRDGKKVVRLHQLP
jgi:hypothetical protein